jgi:spore germination cell wall hydrolase CwlJ-like protein
VTLEQERTITAALDDETALALTMIAEAAGDWREGGSSVEERIAVGCVVRNRVLTARRWAKTVRGVCLQARQFSCWDPGTDANHVRLMTLAERLTLGTPNPDPLLAETRYLAAGIISGAILDRTCGATSYYAPAAMKPAGRKPFWVFRNGKDGDEHPPTAIVGGQVFYRI